jgi:hypothetical protein
MPAVRQTDGRLYLAAASSSSPPCPACSGRRSPHSWLAEGKEQILSFSGERLPTEPLREAEAQYSFHLWMDRQPQQAEFKVNQLEAGTSLRPGAATLELTGRHPIALELERLLVSRRSRRYGYVPRLEAILYGPEHLTLPLLTRTLAAVDEAARQPAS